VHSVRRVLVVAAAALALAASSPAVTASTAPPPFRPAALPWLHVEPSADGPSRLADQWGRTVILRGTNVTGLEDDYYRRGAGGRAWEQPFWSQDRRDYDGMCPVNSHDIVNPPLCEVDAGRPAYEQSAAAGSHNDLAQMRALGFNVIRLTLSWSLLEPTPGRYDRIYLDRISQVVRWAQEQGVYVILDMHQDNYSRFIPETSPVEVPPLLTATPGSGNHNDGAPPWAVLTDGEPSVAPLGQAPFNAQMEAAFTSFWLNRTAPVAQGEAPGAGLQDHYIGAMAALARRFKGNSTVVGYEIMNEPLPGYLPPPAFEAGWLYPFYGRVIDAITGPGLGIADTRHAFFFEPTATRNLVDASLQASLPFSDYPNLVFAPHVYTHVFTVDRLVLNAPPSQSPYPLSWDQAFQTAEAEARAMGTALFVGEYGNGSNEDDEVLANETAAQDRHQVGSTVWTWKANCVCTGVWSTYAADQSAPPAQNLDLIPTRQKYLSRPWPRAVAGQLLGYAYDTDRRSFTVSATSDRRVRRGDQRRETLVYLPPVVRGQVSLTGAAVLDKVVANPDGSRLAAVAPTGAGAYTLSVTPS
jgi:endoglycosylceramidase